MYRSGTNTRPLLNRFQIVRTLLTTSPTHPNGAMALLQMPNHDTTRTLIDISHKTARPISSTQRTTTRAPKPPSPVDGASRGTPDLYDDSTSNDEWFRLRNADLKRRGKL